MLESIHKFSTLDDKPFSRLVKTFCSSLQNWQKVDFGCSAWVSEAYVNNLYWQHSLPLRIQTCMWTMNLLV